MQIIARCPNCGNRWVLDPDAADKRMRCGQCHRLFKVPKPEDVPKAFKIIKQSKSKLYVDEDGKTYG